MSEPGASVTPAAPPADHPRWAAASRVLAAVLGSALLSAVAVVALALVVPAPAGLGTALAVSLAVPLWVTCMCLGFLARRHARAWAGYLAGALLLAALAWARGHR